MCLLNYHNERNFEISIAFGNQCTTKTVCDTVNSERKFLREGIKTTAGVPKIRRFAISRRNGAIRKVNEIECERVAV